MCVSTGNRYLDIGLSIAIGAATGGLMAPAAVAGSLVPVQATMAGFIGSALGGGVAASVGASVLGGAVIGLGTGLLGAALTPQQPTYDLPQQTSQVAQIQQMNTNIATTGSGGRQAATSLAAAISRTKKRKLTQRDVGDLSLDTSSFTNTGLQLA